MVGPCSGRSAGKTSYPVGPAARPHPTTPARRTQQVHVRIILARPYSRTHAGRRCQNLATLVITLFAAAKKDPTLFPSVSRLKWWDSKRFAGERLCFRVCCPRKSGFPSVSRIKKWISKCFAHEKLGFQVFRPPKKRVSRCFAPGKVGFHVSCPPKGDFHVCSPPKSGLPSV